MEIENRQSFEDEINEENYKKQEMFSISNFLNRKLNKPVKENKRIKNSKDALANEIYDYFQKKISFPLIRKWILENGEQCMYEIFNTTKDKGIGLFIWTINRDRTKLK
jgi:hypothetical protein